MRFRLPNKASLLAGGAALLVAIPALSQDRRPESLLPPGFGDPQTLPPPERATPAPRPPRPTETVRPTPETSAPGNAGTEAVAGSENVVETATADAEAAPVDSSRLPRPSNYFTVPQGLQRPTDLVGPLLPGNFGLAPDAFGDSQRRSCCAPCCGGPTRLCPRAGRRSCCAAPCSRICRRRSACCRSTGSAERAALLLKMGEADAARMLVQAVDVEQYTPRMIEAASETALATADPAALCPLVAPARTMSQDQVWLLADGDVRRARGRGGPRRRADRPAARAQRAAASTCSWPRRWSAPARRRGARRNCAGTGSGRSRPGASAWPARPASTIPANLDELRPGPASRPGWPARRWCRSNSALAAASTAASLGRLLLSQPGRDVQPAARPDRSGGSGGHGRRDGCAPPGSARIRRRRLEAMRALWTEQRGRGRAAGTSDPDRRRGGADPGHGRLCGGRPPICIASMLSAGLDSEAARWGGGDRGRAARPTRPGPCSRSARRGSTSPSTSGRIAAFVGADDSPGQQRGPMLVAAWPGSAGSAWTRPPRPASGPAPATSGRQAIDRGGAGPGAGHRRPARRRRHADVRLARGAARASLPDRPGAARRRPRVRGADDRRRGDGAAVSPARARSPELAGRPPVRSPPSSK